MPDLEHIKHGPSETGVLDLILKRWSPRAFSDKPVAAEDLKKIFTAAGWAASSYGEEPWRFIVGVKGDSTYDKIFSTLVEFNQSWAKSAPVLYLSAAKKTFTANGHPDYHNLHDTGAASATAALQAIALGIHTHGMGGYDHKKAREVFQIPEDFDLGAVWALGYLGDPNTLQGGMKDQELAPRKRKPFESYVFSEWDKPAKF